jgi:hypothetical protein
MHRPYWRMLGLRNAAERDLRRGRQGAAAAKAAELLKLAERYSADWYYGNAVHYGHLLLGHVALARGDSVTAGRELLAAASETPGSPQLDTFGPNCRLAKDLLEAGHTEVVVQYLELCGRFWEMGGDRSARWLADIRNGQVPSFGANLVY